ncbi:YdeI/OmpD-associated family protein [Paenibacillus sepulcri]|uniref:YdeI/OmpD-associated family protein n=1 Tax=Paenibacillus sepulcri TaxID=359917 RepID=A0ABS7CBQ3_9BACL|nr:YdeI/OmpD-associated family protein [Paenibacillus sepulcri]
MAVTFNTIIMKAEGKNATGIQVPAEAVAALGKKMKPSVTVSLNGYTYRSTVAVYGSEFFLPLNVVHREAAGVAAGDRVEVTLELDLEPRTVEVPHDLTAALSAQTGAVEVFNALSYSKRKEFVRQVEDAKTQETRERRIAGIVEKIIVS